MHIGRFTYKREDVDCKLCTEYRGGKKCPHPVCPYITERIEAGAVTYQDAVYAMIHPGCQLIRRLPKLILTYQDSFWVDDRHKSRMEFFNTCMGYVPSRNTPAYYAAMYLLTANETLYWRMANCFCHSGLDFSFAILRGMKAIILLYVLDAIRLGQFVVQQESKTSFMRALVSELSSKADLIKGYGQGAERIAKAVYAGGHESRTDSVFS